MEHWRRLVLALLPLVLLSIQYKSHGKASPEASVAFVHFSRYSIPVRIQGDLEHQGVYKFSDGARISTAIKMTVPKVCVDCVDKKTFSAHISPGDVVHIHQRYGKCPEFLMGKMSVREKLLLGIPLHPDELTTSDWQLLPGIGPRTARAIVLNRQSNGAFGSIERVERVSGVSNKTIDRLIIWF